ncbi:MAG: flippase-like domain-containing protein [Chloroflexota bacterium]|nr:flippase-like domain-containing protein [Chloroflexota bacterium]
MIQAGWFSRAGSLARHGQRLRKATPLARHQQTLVWLAVLPLGAVLLGPRVNELPRTLAALGSVHIGWLLAAVLSAAAVYPLAAWAQMGAVSRPLAFGRTVTVQVAAMFVAQLTPQGIGGMGLNGRYLEREGVERPAAVGAVTLNLAAGAVVHVLALVLVLALLGRSTAGYLDRLHGWPVWCLLILAVVLTGSVLYARSRRFGVPSSVYLAVHSVQQVLRRPPRAVALFGGSAGITGAYALTLALTLSAYGVDVSPLQVLAIYLGSAAVGALMPTPGGLGAMEGALIAGLTTLGVAFAPALAAVSTFRLLTYWLPILPGFVAFRYLQQRRVI